MKENDFGFVFCFLKSEMDVWHSQSKEEEEKKEGNERCVRKRGQEQVDDKREEMERGGEPHMLYIPSVEQ